MSTPIVELKNISRVYRQGELQVRAVDSLDLQIEAGEFTVLCGPSGSGKTTILNLIGGLDAPTSGEVFIEGSNTAQLDRSTLSNIRRDRIGFVFQAYNLIPVLTAFENAEFVLALQGVDPKERRTRVMSVLEEVGLGGLEHRRPDELSGGQQQRVAIARAIAPRPAVVLADEPTANLDSETAEALMDVMGRLNREENATFVFSTHDERVMRRARRIVTLIDGRIHKDEQLDR